MACTEKGLENAWSDVSCNQLFTDEIVESLYNERTGLTCQARHPGQSGGCGWGEIMTPNYQSRGWCPTPQDCTPGNWMNCRYGTGGYDAYIYGCCRL